MQISEKLQAMLEQHVVEIKFKKIDGNDRTMICSRKKEFLSKQINKTENKKQKNENVLAVWDLEKEAFRSFRLDSLIDYAVFREGYEL